MADPNTDNDLRIIPTPTTAATFMSTLFPNNRAPKPGSRPPPTDERDDAYIDMILNRYHEPIQEVYADWDEIFKSAKSMPVEEGKAATSAEGFKDSATPAEPIELKAYGAALAALWGVLLPTNVFMAITMPPFEVPVCKIQTITQALEALNLEDGSSMPLTARNTTNTAGNTASQTAPSACTDVPMEELRLADYEAGWRFPDQRVAPSSSDPTVAATCNNIKDNPFLFPKRPWGTGSGPSASSSTTVAPNWPDTIDAPTIFSNFTTRDPSPPGAGPTFSQDTHYQWQMGIPPTFFDANTTQDDDDASDINDANRYTSRRGAPVTPAFHPRLEGVYYASPDPVIPPVVYQNICMSPEWMGMSMEELRMANYKAGWKFPDQKWRV